MKRRPLSHLWIQLSRALQLVLCHDAGWAHGTSAEVRLQALERDLDNYAADLNDIELDVLFHQQWRVEA